MPDRIAILGAGGMGTALAVLLARNGADVSLWARDASRASEIAATRENRRHLPGIVLPETVRVTADAAQAVAGAGLLVVAIPSSFLRATLTRLCPVIQGGEPVLSVVKGIEVATFARPGQVVLETLGPRSVSVLSGPGHAEELARGLPASLVVAGGDDTLNVLVRDLLNHGRLRVYTNADPLGVELAGALKNVLGVAAGICDGLEFGDNAKAALLTRGLTEITRLGVALGARAGTFAGLAGVGDVVTTCYSPFGRNRAVGFRIGRGATLAEVLDGMTDVAEGVTTARSAHELAARRRVAMPITDEVYRILFEGKSPLEALSDLMLRPPKGEAP